MQTRTAAGECVISADGGGQEGNLLHAVCAFHQLGSMRAGLKCGTHITQEQQLFLQINTDARVTCTVLLILIQWIH